jgi:single-stranded-DNA-specific exonuclease
MIVPDAGGGDVNHVTKLKEHGIDVLVLDHHDSPRESYGPGVVINNQFGGYPNRTLSGVGVVYKFCEHIDQFLGIKAAEQFLDLVAVGCVADLMPLTNFETLYYIRKGIQNLRNPFIRTMVKEQEYSINKHGEFDPFCIGFYVAPFINATIRVGTMDEKLMLFESLLDSKGYTLVSSGKRGHKGEQVPLAEEACRVCANVKSRQTKLRDDNLPIIEKLIEEHNLLENKIVAVKLPKELGIDKSILGLMANILMDKYQRPILLLNEVTETINNEPKKAWAGSARNYKYSEITDLRQFIEYMPHSLYAQGHASAFGTSILDEDFDDFIRFTNICLEDIDFSPVYRVDCIFAENDDADYYLMIDSLKCYYGQGFEEPYIAITDVHVNSSNMTLMSKDKNPTIKITLPSGAEIMKFKSSQEEYDALLDTVIDVVGKCSANRWMGRVTPQVLVEDYEIKRMDF